MNMRISEIESDKIRVSGRTTPSLDPLTMVWAGSSIEFCVKAGWFKILLAGPYTMFENWIAIEINGEVLSRRMISSNKEWITVFRMMNPNNPVRVRILKEGQAFESDCEHRIEIFEIETDGELLPVSDKSMRIEFVGDSINSAEGCIGATSEMDWIAQFFSHTNSYPYMVGKMLDAQINVISQSGWGIYASWDCDCNHVLPKYYEDICSLMTPGYFDKNGFYDKWDFASWQPDTVVINLGTNDEAAFHNVDCLHPEVLRMDGDNYVEEDRLKVRTAMVDFVKLVRRNNPNADIYWAFGILGDNMTPTVKEALEIYRKETKDEKVIFIDLPDTKEGEFGSRCHPGRKAHENAAKAICEAIMRRNKEA